MEELLKKLRFKEGRAAVLNAPGDYRPGIEAEGKTEGIFDFIQLFVNDAREVEEWVPRVIPLLGEGAVFWITYPKQTKTFKSDINRDILARMVQDLAPYWPVSNVAVDEKWSALRFRPKDQVQTRK